MRQKLMSNVFCYLAKVFTERAKEAPHVQGGMKKVEKEQNEQREMPCEYLRGNEQKIQIIEF